MITVSLRVLYRSRTDKMNIYLGEGFIRLAHTIWAECSNNVCLPAREAENQANGQSIRLDVSEASTKHQQPGGFLEKQPCFSLGPLLYLGHVWKVLSTVKGGFLFSINSSSKCPQNLPRDVCLS